MAYEIERKFLLKNDDWRADVYQTVAIKQAYLCNTEKASLRIRIANQQAYISSKTMTESIRRHEFEYEIPFHDGEFMLMNMCLGSPIIKTRHLVREGQYTWEIDEFYGDNSGLLVAEIELEHEQQIFQHPAWLGREVSDDRRYINVSLVRHPFKDWLQTED